MVVVVLLLNETDKSVWTFPRRDETFSLQCAYLLSQQNPKKKACSQPTNADKRPLHSLVKKIFPLSSCNLTRRIPRQTATTTTRVSRKKHAKSAPNINRYWPVLSVGRFTKLPPFILSCLFLKLPREWEESAPKTGEDAHRYSRTADDFVVNALRLLLMTNSFVLEVNRVSVSWLLRGRKHCLWPRKMASLPICHIVRKVVSCLQFYSMS